MVVPSNPSPIPDPSLVPATHKGVGDPSSEGKGWKASPMTFLGMHFNAKEAQKLWQAITQSISNTINKDKEKALKALKKLNAKSEDQS